MTEHKISLTFVRLAIKRAQYKGFLRAAMTLPYRPALNWDGTLLHGACITFDLNYDFGECNGDSLR